MPATERVSSFRCVHEWQRIPFWHVNAWADHWTHRCGKCHLVRSDFPSTWAVRGFFAWRLIWAALAVYGASSLALHVLGR